MRSLILAAQAKGCSKIHNPLPSPDTERMIQALDALGVLTQKKKSLLVEGGLQPKNAKIDVGNSGLAFRFITTLAALGDQKLQQMRRAERWRCRR